MELGIKRLSTCILSNNGKTYCYDLDLLEWVCLDMVVVKMKDLPDDVLKSITRKVVHSTLKEA